MLDWLRSGKEQKTPGESEYIDTLETLRQKVSDSIKNANDYASHLHPEYSEEALSSISSYFENISKEYTNSTIRITDPFYEVIQRSHLRLKTAKKVASQAKALAQLFDKYARRRNTYNAVNGRLEINKLVGELTNLEALCLQKARKP